MPVKCPSCNLLFGTRNELDWHVREEHTRSRLPARSQPADDAAPADPTAPVNVAARAGPDGQPLPPTPSAPDPAEMEPGRQRGSVRRLFRRSRPARGQ